MRNQTSRKQYVSRRRYVIASFVPEIRKLQQRYMQQKDGYEDSREYEGWVVAGPLPEAAPVRLVIGQNRLLTSSDARFRQTSVRLFLRLRPAQAGHAYRIRPSILANYLHKLSSRNSSLATLVDRPGGVEARIEFDF